MGKNTAHKMADKRAFHEDLGRAQRVEAGSDRAFGGVFTAVFTLIGLHPLIGGGDARLWALILAGVFLVPTLLFPRLLHPLNQLWARFGGVLHRIVTPVVLGFIFFTTVTPMALLLKVLGKDPLHRRFDPASRSYWIEREPGSPEPTTMKNQF